MAALDYVLGHTPDELRRLQLQSELLEPATRRLLQRSGLRSGARVLDIGTGAGDVALLTAEIVGPSGSVLGIDPAEKAIGTARQRASTASSQVEFRLASLEDLSPDLQFDLVVGRLVLLHQQDHAAFVRRAASHVAPGGVLAFLDLDLHHALPIYALPAVPLFEEAADAAMRVWASVGVRCDGGSRFLRTFFEAGLSEPRLMWDQTHVSGNCDTVEWLCLLLKSLEPALRKIDPALAGHLDVATLQPRLTHALAIDHSQVSPPRLAGAWLTLPDALTG